MQTVYVTYNADTDRYIIRDAHGKRLATKETMKQVETMARRNAWVVEAK